MANTIHINDFSLFFDSLKSLAKLVDSAKLIFSPTGLEIYGARDVTARCEYSTNSVYSDDNFDICIDNIGMFNRVLSTIKDVHNDDYSELEIKYAKPNLWFKSKKMKMKYSLCNESTILKWISKKIETPMSSVFDFKTSSDFIKRINSHGFLFSDSKAIKAYIETKQEMESNAVYMTLGNRQVDIGKEITLQFGLVTSGVLNDDRTLIIDLERMNLFNAIQSDDINISLMDKNVLLSKTKVAGKNGSFFHLNIYCTLLKS